MNDEAAKAVKAPPRIKICGITRQEDALFAAGLGVDALGFVLAPSPRQIEPEAVRRITDALPPFVSTVGVFVDADPEHVRYLVKACGLDWVQLHGNESAEYCRGLGVKSVKGIRIKDYSSITTMASYKGTVQGFVLDTYVKGQKGGTGKTFDWELAHAAASMGPIILAGGLTPETVARAIAAARPFGVDVSSGVESAPGIKDRDKIAAFVQAVRQTP